MTWRSPFHLGLTALTAMSRFAIHSAALPFAFHKPDPPPPPIERIAWTMFKAHRRVDLVQRRHPAGTEIRCVYRGDLLWTELLESGPDHHGAVQRAVDDARAAWLANGWHEWAD